MVCAVLCGVCSATGVGLIAGIAGAPVTATTIAVAMLGAETLELANNLENNYIRQI